MRINSKIGLAKTIFPITTWRGRGGDRCHIIKHIDLIQHMNPSTWIRLIGRKAFCCEKLAYQPQVMFMVLLFCPVTVPWLTNSNILLSAEEMASNGIWPKRELHCMHWEHSWSTCTPSFCVLDVSTTSTCLWINFCWKSHWINLLAN